MPITLPASVDLVKESTPLLPGIPLLLAEFTFIDGSTLFLSTHPLNRTEGSIDGYDNGTGNGVQAYFARINQQSLGTIQARSEQGIDRVATVQLNLSDSDRTLVTNIEFFPARGFKGAVLVLRLIFWQADTTNFSSDSRVIFSGICDGPQYEQKGKGDELIINATTSHNLARITLPNWHVQPICGNDFPIDSTERKLGATDMSHHCWSCGYDPDQAGTDPELHTDARRGNVGAPGQTDSTGRAVTDGSGMFVICNKTRSDCVLRGMFDHDSGGRKTGRFNGIEWSPVNREVKSKSYLQGKTITFIQLGRNDTIFSERFPMLYGLQWVNPVIANVVGDANGTDFEFVVCQDDITSTNPIGGGAGSSISQLVVNGVIVPYTDSSPDQKEFQWLFVNTGSRNGSVNPGNLYNSLGDPYGSLATGVCRVYQQLAEAGSPPNVRALTFGPHIKVPNSANPAEQPAWPKKYTTNPCWILLDLLIWANFRYTEIDLQSFLDNAPYCDHLITYTNLNNVTKQHERFKCEFVLEKGRAASEVITAILHSFSAQLSRDPRTGLFRLVIRKTLADQQPIAVPGSNTTDGIRSVHVDSTSGVGYPAYLFDERVILRDGPDSPPKIKWYTQPSSQAPNEVFVQFQDEDNSYSDDSITIKDPAAIQRAGGFESSQEIPEQYNVIGFSTFDQAFRVANAILAENNRGNPQSDTRGTYYFEFDCTVRVSHLKAGDIVLFNWNALAFQPSTPLKNADGSQINGILCRIIDITPATNFATAHLKLAWHEDIWYTDKYGQQGPPQYSDARKGPGGRPPYPWQPDGVPPVDFGDSIYGTPPEGALVGSWLLFQLAQQYNVDGSGNLITQLLVTGQPPVNIFSKKAHPPLVAVEGSVDPAGGSFPGGIDFFMAISAIDEDGLQSALSPIFKVSIPSGTNTNRVITPTIYWQAGTRGYILYGGRHSNALTGQLPVIDAGLDSGGELPPTLNTGFFNYQTWGPPDTLAHHLRLRAKRIIHGGVWGAEVYNVVTGRLTFRPFDPVTLLPTTFTAGQWVGYDIQLVAHFEGSTDPIQVIDFRVTDNDGTHLFVTPDPLAAGIVPTDSMVMLIKPDASSTATRIVDPNFINAYAPAGLAVNEQATHGNEMMRVLTGTGRYQNVAVKSNDATSFTLAQPLKTPLDSTSRIIIEEAAWSDTVDSAPLAVSDYSEYQTFAFDVSPYYRQTILATVDVIDSKGNTSIENYAPMRQVFIWGSQAASDPLTIGGTQYVITFGLAIGQDLVTGTNVCPIFEVRRAGTPVDVRIQFKTGPVGADIKIDILRTPVGTAGPGTSIFDGTPLVIPAGATLPITYANFNLLGGGTGAAAGTPTLLHSSTRPPFAVGDVLQVDVTQVGSSTPGKDISVFLKMSVP